MWTVIAALELLALAKKRQELLLALPVERNANRTMFIDPLAALDCELLPLHSDFHRFL